MHLSGQLFWCLALSPIVTIGATSVRYADHSPHEIHSQSWLSSARDSLIQCLWQVPEEKDSVRPNGRKSPKTGDATALQTRYGGDLVLRFDIKTHEEGCCWN